MNLKYQAHTSLPRLSWCAVVSKSEPFVEVLCGPWVERRDTFFCDGAWAGPFEAGKLDSCQLVGTGGRVTKEGIVFAAPNNTLERLYMIQAKNRILVSNSMIFLLAQTDDNVISGHLSYGARRASLLAGLRGYDRSMPTRKGVIKVFYHCNVLVTPDLELTEYARIDPDPFPDFDSYREFLAEQVAAIFSNARSPERRIRYEPIIALSRGYDSSAAAVLSSEAGCSEALTLRESRGRGGQVDPDSGEELAGHLRMKVHSFDRFAYKKKRGFPEAENAGGPHVFSAWEKELEGRLFVTAFLGGSVWDRNREIVNTEIRRTDTSGCFLTEFRLRAGFVQFDIPYLGCTQHPSIHHISNSEQMNPWSVGGDYDKPIARRIIEEAGVPRGTFAVRKAAVEVSMRVEGLRSVLTEESYTDFISYYKEHWTLLVRLRALWFRTITHLYRKNIKLNKRISGILKRRLGLKVRLGSLFPDRLRYYANGAFGPEALLFQWSVQKLLPRYKIEK